MSQISVIVPVYKVEQYLHHCVDSILAQSFTDFQLILVDDGSPDNCPEICDEYAKKDERVIVIHQKNGGLSAARNAGIDWVFANSDSEWITFIDSDDWIHPQCLEFLYINAISTKTYVSICGYQETEGENIYNAVNNTPFIYSPEDFYVQKSTSAIIACAKLYNKNCFKNIRYPNGKIHEDEFTTYKILFAERLVVATSAQLYYYRQNPKSITKAEWNIKRLDGLGAVSEQIAYFSSHNFLKAAATAKHRYIAMLANNIFLAKKSDSRKKYKHIIKKLEKELRKLLHKYHTDYPISKHMWLYENAYPRTSNIYWTLKGIANKFKRS